VLVIRGEPGIGKTALLEYAVASADGMRVARVVGVESEMQLTSALVYQLLAPMFENPDLPPARQRGAVASAFRLIIPCAKLPALWKARFA